MAIATSKRAAPVGGLCRINTCVATAPLSNAVRTAAPSPASAGLGVANCPATDSAIVAIISLPNKLLIMLASSILMPICPKRIQPARHAEAMERATGGVTGHERTELIDPLLKQLGLKAEELSDPARTC